MAIIFILVKFNNPEKNKLKNTFDSVNALYEGRNLTVNAFKSGIFPIKAKKGEVFKISTPKKMLQRLPISLAEYYLLLLQYTGQEEKYKRVT